MESQVGLGRREAVLPMDAAAATEAPIVEIAEATVEARAAQAMKNWTRSSVGAEPGSEESYAAVVTGVSLARSSKSEGP